MAQPPFRLWDFAVKKLEQIEADSSHLRKGKQQPSSSYAAEQLQKLRAVLGDVQAGLENMFAAGQALPEATWKQLGNDKVSKWLNTPADLTSTHSRSLLVVPALWGNLHCSKLLKAPGRPEPL